MAEDVSYVDLQGNAYWRTSTENGVYTVIIPHFTHTAGAIARINPDTSNVGFININDVATLPITSEFPLAAGAYYDLIFDAINVCFVVNKTVLLNVINSPNGLIVKATSTYVHRFVAVGQGTNSIAYSPDGINWTGLGADIFTIYGGISVCWNGSIFVAVGWGTYKIAYSPDGVNWTGISSSLINGNDVCWNGSNFVLAGSSNYISPDGINWSLIDAGLNSGLGVCWNGNLFVMGGSGLINSIAYSPDGTNWTGLGKTIFSVCRKVCWGNDMFVAVGSSGLGNSIAYSPDGTNWTGLGADIFGDCLYVCWGNNMFIAVGGGETNTMAYSPDGINWTGLGKTIFSTLGTGVSWNGSRFTATGAGTNSIAYSPDGINWTGLGTDIFGDRGNNVCHTLAPELIPTQTKAVEYSQTANLQEWHDANGNVKASVSPDGDISGRDLTLTRDLLSGRDIKFTRDLYYNSTKILTKAGNDAIILNNVIYGKMALNKGVYTGNATARAIATVFHPHFGCCKSATAVYGALWTILGGSKGYAAVNSAGNFMGVSANGTGFNLGTGAFCNTNLAAYKYFALAAHGGALTGVKAKVITWTGNNTDNRNLDIGLDPDVFIVKAANANYALFKTTDHTGEACSYFLYGAADLATNGIQAMGDLGGGVHGVQLGTNAAVNSAGIVYNGLALKSDADGASEIAIAKFNGMAGDGCKVWLPFQANAIFALPATALDCLFWTSAMTPGETGIITTAAANITTGIMRADDDGIIIGSGTQINTVNNIVIIVAIKCDL